jgi:hypothetical protein
MSSMMLPLPCGLPKQPGGKDNYAADRQAVRQLLKAAPEARDSARAKRAFLQRAVRFLAGKAGIRQIIDIGTGIPAAGNVHEVAAQVAPGIRVAYVDSDRCKPGLCTRIIAGRAADRAQRLARSRNEETRNSSGWPRYHQGAD